VSVKKVQKQLGSQRKLKHNKNDSKGEGTTQLAKLIIKL